MVFHLECGHAVLANCTGVGLQKLVNEGRFCCPECRVYLDLTVVHTDVPNLECPLCPMQWVREMVN